MNDDRVEMNGHTLFPSATLAFPLFFALVGFVDVFGGILSGGERWVMV